MPRPARRSDKKSAIKKKNSSSAGDITINDFANSPSGVHNRLKKAVVNNGVVEPVIAEEEMKKQSRSRRKNKLLTGETSEDYEGIDYPIDLWYLISEHIAPEAVGKFARICRSSHYVVKTAKFWFHLYKRFYKRNVDLPERLTPACMVRPYGLRACVIRALHFTYFPSIDKISHNVYSAQEEPHSLVKRRCCLMWHKKGESRWYFYFKLKETNVRNVMREQFTWDSEHAADINELLNDVAVNSEEGCQILRVACTKYAMVPLVTGLILQTVKLDLSPGFEHHRLQLGFGNTYIPKTPTQTVILSGVVDCKVLNWWHQCYPHQDSESKILQTTPESWDTPNFFDSPLRLDDSDD